MSRFILAMVLLSSLPTVLNRMAKILLLVTGRICRRPLSGQPSQQDSPGFPYVAVHMAIRKEAPAIVLETLASLEKLDYPDYMVLVIDNNTNDQCLWTPIEDFCRRRSDRFVFHHIEHMAGYKAGALNYALERTPPHIEFIAIVDADTIVKPNFLRETIPSFRDERVAIVQTPLGFVSDPSQHHFMSWIYLIYRYFLSIYMPAADQFGRAPCIGAMGLLRRSALEMVGGWNGCYLTEDMELTYRLFRQGFVSCFIDYSYGHSMPPATFDNFKRQHYRWNFGNAQILRDYLYTLVLRRRESRLHLLDQLIYFACPGIYLNCYFIPFALATVLVALMNLAQASSPLNDLSCTIMLGVLTAEIFGEALMFIVLGHYEHAPWSIRMKNLVGWWTLSVNNAWSTLAVFFVRTRPFEITPKGEKHDSVIPSLAAREVCFIVATFGVALVSALTSFAQIPLTVFIGIILGGLSAMVLIIRK